MPAITLAGEQLIAKKQADRQTLTVDRFILAHIPGLKADDPVDRSQGKPSPQQVVGEFDVTQSNYVNLNTVVYSLILGSDVGDFSFNWLGLYSSTDTTLMAVTHAPLTEKLTYQDNQVGNNLTRNFMLEFNGAQDVTQMTVSADTWQSDWTARLSGMDHRSQQQSADVYGRSCFWVDGFKVQPKKGGFQLQEGTGYVEGLRVATQTTDIDPGVLPKQVWADVRLEGGIAGKTVTVDIVFSKASKTHYTDDAGTQHYLVALASINGAGKITDRRRVFNVGSDLISFLSRHATDTEAGWNRQATKQEVLQGKGTGVVTAERLDQRLAHLYGVFPGVMVEFAGKEDQIAQGWQLCNGQGYTSNGIKIPDRRNRFTVGGGGDYQYGEFGGADVRHTSEDGRHGHDLTINPGGLHWHGVNIYGHALTIAEMPSHNHDHQAAYHTSIRYGSKGGYGHYGGGSADDGASILLTSTVGANQPHNHGASVHNSGNHSHSSSLKYNGEHNHTVRVIPRYYATCHIIKL